ncbi:MAG TPA: lytic transglycosylase domain-containing protein [Solirubrobacteraceae bacterium]|nr:lytic transglycosylase domain-containing protein [Solirubrobacteraceae bacterium]
MSPPAATVTARRRTGRHRTVVRRRRRALASFIGIGALVLVIVLALPLFRRAVNDLTLPLSYSDVIRQQAAEKHLDPALIAAVIYAETKFDPRPSSAGAEGLMQILPQTAEFLARRSGATTFTVADLGTPQVNIAYGSYYLRYLLDLYKGEEVPALAAYNGGTTNVDHWLVFERQQGRPLTVSEIPFPQTQAYVAKVLDAQKRYRQTYPSELGYS